MIEQGYGRNEQHTAEDTLTERRRVDSALADIFVELNPLLNEQYARRHGRGVHRPTLDLY